MPLRVCCLAYHAYPVIEPTAKGDYGGTETRAWLFARGLAAIAGLEVSFVVRSRRPLVQRTYDGVRLIRRIAPLWWLRYRVASRVERVSRFPWLRIRRWSGALLWQIPLLAVVYPFRKGPPNLSRPDRFFTEIEADVFCCFGVHRDSATLIKTAQACGKKSVLFLGANSDLDERYKADSTYVTPYGERAHVCWFALAHADRVVVQTPWQQKTLRERFGRDSVLIQNPIDVAGWERAQAGAQTPPEAQGLSRYALWIGRADDFHKRPLLCLDLARRCPEVPFLMVVNPREREIEAQIRSHSPPNVRVVDSVPFARMPLVFAKAAVYINTSVAAYEGFPNVFLQAAASGVPIASLELDHDFVERGRCGLVAHGDLERLAEYVRTVCNDRRERDEEGARGRQHVREHYDLPAKAAQVAELIRDLCGAAVARP